MKAAGTHSNVVSLLEVYQGPTGIASLLMVVETILVVELVTGGELFDYILKKGALSEEIARSLLGSVCSALAHLHSLGICHNDIKPYHEVCRSQREHSSFIEGGDR